jgi:hypothetical protein
MVFAKGEDDFKIFMGVGLRQCEHIYYTLMPLYPYALSTSCLGKAKY